jgi:hypothetical protein
MNLLVRRKIKEIRKDQGKSNSEDRNREKRNFQQNGCANIEG